MFWSAFLGAAVGVVAVGCFLVIISVLIASRHDRGGEA